MSKFASISVREKTLMWKKIHEYAESGEQIQIQLKNVLKVFETLERDVTCSCSMDARQLFEQLLLNDDTNFQLLDDTRGFFILFHNWVNLKLSKDIF